MGTKLFNSKNYKKLALIFFNGVFVDNLWALDSESPVGKGLNYILTDVLYGGTGATLGTLSVAGVGLACKFGFFEWRRLGQTIAGISLVFGAPAIVSGIKNLIN